MNLHKIMKSKCYQSTRIIICISLFVLMAFSGPEEAEREVDRELLLELINSYRTSGVECGGEYQPPVDPLTWNDSLAAAAQAHSDDMFENDFLSHTGSDNSLLAGRIDLTGYDWRTIGENIAMVHREAEHRVVEGWITSPQHCMNIMRADFEEMGVARTGKFWTQVLAKPRH